jgi:hypothetical protein
MGEWLLSRRDRLIVARHEVPWPGGPCPKGAGGLSPGFQPWEPPPERCALKLKGRQIEPTNKAAVKPNCSTPQLRTLILAQQWVRALSGQPLAPSGRIRLF